tara:strand:+ start:1950 stop:2411 length:462 start_codon:yes stop_codon:yes gene_type:complete
MADYAYKLYSKEVKFINLADLDIPFCDGDKCYDNENVKDLKGLILSAKSIIIASPIYNYDLNAAAKNLIELTGRSWTNKVVGFICAAGGKSSYMSPLSFMNSLMVDFRCIIVPRFVYADGEFFDENNNLNSEIKDRIKELVDSSIHISEKLDL